MDEIDKYLSRMDEVEKLAVEHSQNIFDVVNRLHGNNDNDMLQEIYLYVKGITNLYYYDNCYEKSLLPAYKLIRFSVGLAEEKVSSRIINIPINFELLDDKKNDKSFLDYVVYSTRKYLLEKRYLDSKIVRLDKINFADECLNAANFIKAICDENGIESYILQIAPGYDINSKLYDCDGLKYHYFNVIKYAGEYYLLDITYLQFFYTRYNILDRIGLVNIPPCDPGCFMMMSNIGQEAATEIIKNGYIKLDEKVFKIYLDAFTISFRNGLYYENTNDFSFTTNYSIEDYIRFLNGEDNQINYEGEENLGYQKSPLKKIISFKDITR